MPTFSIDQHVEFGKWLEGGIQTVAKKACLSTAMRVVSVITTELIPNEEFPPIFDGHYRSGWRADPTEKGADVYNDIPYASIIEDGARAENIKIGGAMIEALTEWVRRKGLAGPPAKSRSAKATQLVNARNIAWAIAVSMKTKGIFNRDGRKGLKIAERAMARVPTLFREEFAAELKRKFGG